MTLGQVMQGFGPGSPCVVSLSAYTRPMIQYSYLPLFHVLGERAEEAAPTVTEGHLIPKVKPREYNRNIQFLNMLLLEVVSIF